MHEPGANIPVGGGGAGRLESPRQPSEQVAHAVGELPGAPGRLAEPEREVRRLAVRILHADRAALDAQDAPRRVAELEDVAGQALDREILVERAETGPVGLQHHVVVGVVGDRAARGHRGEAGAAPGAQLAVDDVAVQVRGAPAPPGRESAGEHRQKLPPSLAVEIPVRPGATHRREQRVLAPVLGRDHGDDLLREDVERMHRHVQRIELAAPHRVEYRGALDELVPRERKQPSLRGAVHRVAGTPGTLQEGRDGAGGAELADQVDVPDVDPELERGGGHQGLEIAGLEALLGRERRSRDRLPWCEVTCSSPSDSVSARATRSAMRRVLTNTSVVRCASMRARSRPYTSAQTSPDITASSGDSGSSSARSRSLVWPVSTMVQVPGVPSSQPVRKWATVSMGRWVADSPMRVTGRPASASRRSSESARWAPRLLPATAWISSTMAVPTLASMARPPSLVRRM